MSLEVAISELNTNILALIGVMSGATAPATPAKQATKKAAPAAALVAAASPTPEAAPASQPVAAPKQEPATAAPTMEEVRALAIKLGQVKGREALVTMLTDFGVSKTPELPPHQYASFISKAAAAIAA
jgi:hypothetical protein